MASYIKSGNSFLPHSAMKSLDVLLKNIENKYLNFVKFNNIQKKIDKKYL